jgi:hypothetical protein
LRRALLDIADKIAVDGLGQENGHSVLAPKGLGDLPNGLVGALAEVAVYPRPLPAPDLIKHCQLLIK